MQSHKHQQPSFQSLGSPVSSGSSQEISYPTVHALHHIYCRGQVQVRIQKIRAVLIQSPQDFAKPVPIGLGTQRMSDVPSHTHHQAFGDHRVSRRNDFPHRLIRSSPPTPPSDAPLDASQEYIEAGHEMKMASLQDPAVIGCHILNASNTIGNQGLYAIPDTTGHIADAPAPSFRRFPFLTQNRTQEYGILSVHASHRHQIGRPAFSLESEPQPIDDQNQRAGRNTSWPWFAVQRSKRCGIPLTHGGNCSMSAVCSARQRLLASHGLGNTGQSPFPWFPSSPFLPDRPGYSASDTLLPTFTVPMNRRVRTPDFSVLCFHTQRIQDRNRQTSTIFLA